MPLDQCDALAASPRVVRCDDDTLVLKTERRDPETRKDLRQRMLFYPAIAVIAAIGFLPLFGARTALAFGVFTALLAAGAAVIDLYDTTVVVMRSRHGLMIERRNRITGGKRRRQVTVSDRASLDVRPRIDPEFDAQVFEVVIRQPLGFSRVIWASTSADVARAAANKMSDLTGIPADARR